MKDKLKILSLFRKLSEWKRMYRLLKFLAIDGSDTELFAHCGHNVEIHPNSTLVPKNIIAEDFTRIQNLNNMISYHGKLILKKYSCISSQCIIVPGMHTPTVGVPQYLSRLHVNDKDGEIVVHEDCMVGAGSILLAHCELGRGSWIGAGSIVTRPVPPYAVVAGSPATIIGAKFTKEQILEHERILYPPEERMKETEIDELFEKYYKGLKTIGTSNISNEDKQRLQEYKRQIGMTDFSNLNE